MIHTFLCPVTVTLKHKFEIVRNSFFVRESFLDVYYIFTSFYLLLFSRTEENLVVLKEDEYIICLNRKVCECNFVQNNVEINKYQRS